MNRFAVYLVAGVLASSPGLSLAQEGANSLEELAVEMAHTPAQLADLARYFRGKAEQARADSRTHAGMARAYGGGRLPQRLQMANHCNRLAKKYDEIAEEYEALTKLNEEESKKAQ